MSVASSVLPSRSRPHSASTSASTSPESSLRIRVFTLPRIGRIVRSGRHRINWAWRRNEAVPILGPSVRPRGLRLRRQKRVARQHTRNRQPGREPGLQILQGMHRQINMPGDQFVLDLLCEQPLTADLGEQPVLHPVAGRADRHNLDAPFAASSGWAATKRSRTRAVWRSAVGLPRVPMRRRRCGTGILLPARSTPLQPTPGSR
jgi:hypothetical protein